MVKNASNRQYRKKNTDIDWGKHEMTIRQEGSITIHHLKFPDSSIYNVKFINGEGVLTVTGDFGNWVFCSPFVPSETGYVSEAYWLEKLRIASCQIRMNTPQMKLCCGLRKKLQRLKPNGKAKTNRR